METNVEWEYSMETIVEWEFVIYLRSMTMFHTMVMMMGPLPNITLPVKPTLFQSCPWAVFTVSNLALLNCRNLSPTWQHSPIYCLDVNCYGGPVMLQHRPSMYYWNIKDKCDYFMQGESINSVIIMRNVTKVKCEGLIIRQCCEKRNRLCGRYFW